MRARVKEHHNYGGDAPAGTIVEVDASELERVPWCLEAVEDTVEEAAQAASDEAAAPKPKRRK